MCFVEDHVNLPVFAWGHVFSNGEGCHEQGERLQPKMMIAT